MTIAFIGDVHGHVDPLREVVSVARERAQTLVFLGDYIDRGPDARAVIDYLIALQADPTLETVFLVGNHDAELLRVLNGKGIDLLLKMGGARTIGNYVEKPFGDVAQQLRASFPAAHREFLDGLQHEFRTDKLLAVHQAPASPPDEIFFVSGHKTQNGGVPSISGRQAQIDTGCGTIAGGRLTVYFWPDNDWVQSVTRTEVR